MLNYRYVEDTEYFICPECGGRNIGDWEEYFMCQQCGRQFKWLTTGWNKNVCAHCKWSEREYFSEYPNLCHYNDEETHIEGYDHICDNFELE